MSDKQDGLKKEQFSRREFVKLIGAGTMFLGLSVFGISNLLKKSVGNNGSSTAQQ
jgi:hypothetical protein